MARRLSLAIASPKSYNPKENRIRVGSGYHQSILRASPAATLTKSPASSLTAYRRRRRSGTKDETTTNYPLVRITNTSSGHVVYAKTHDHSTMGVATRKTTVSTNFDVPAGMETGASSLEVVANGIPSKKVSITVN